MSWRFLPTDHSVMRPFHRVLGIAALGAVAFFTFVNSASAFSNWVEVSMAFHKDDARLVWPRTATTATGDKVTFSQPQVDQWSDGILYAKVATKVQLANATSPVEGTVTLRARATINQADRTVTLRDITAPALRFPADENQIEALRDIATTSLQRTPVTIAFDDLIASMLPQAFPTPTSTIISNKSPRIIFQDSLIANATDLNDSPVECIQSDGALKFDPIVLNQLDGASNTSSLLFRDHEGTYYLLVSGRWLTADSLNHSAWEFLESAQLPTAFSAIPESSRWAEALASVPNTTANRIALLCASLPSERTLSRTTTISIEWQGEPQFIATDSPNLFCAINANVLVLKLGNDLYCNTLDAWFTAPNPSGPWTLCVKIPPAIASLQIKSPLFHCRFVQVAESTPTTVTFRSTSATRSEYVNNGLVVYGSGFPIPSEMAGIKALPTPTYSQGIWWNPWLLGFSTESCISIPNAEQVATEALVPNAAEENHFIGLDGRVYAHRGDLWFRNTSDGQWVELTEQRSTLRVLRSDDAARQAAITTRREFSRWIAKQESLRSKSVDGCGRILSMDGVRPSSDGFRCAIPAGKIEPSK